MGYFKKITKIDKATLLLAILIITLFIIVFRSFFSLASVGGKDWDYLFRETIEDFTLFPSAWSSTRAGNLGSYDGPFAYMFFYSRFIPKILVDFFHVNHGFIEKITWFWFFLFFVFFSPLYLFKTLHFSSLSKLFGLFIFIFNTYVLMVIGGGQMGVAIGYSLMPLILALYIKSITKKDTKNKIFLGLTCALSLAYDPRITYLSFALILFYTIFNHSNIRPKTVIKTLFIILIITVGIHFYWIFPMLTIHSNFLLDDYGTSRWLKFLSSGDFSHTLSLLQPNWPENIFGKTYFMRPEFIILPILAFSSLLFIDKPQVKKFNLSIFSNFHEYKLVLFFVLLALTGSFLAKGVNPPFGWAYQWLFEHIPGMNMFRDPTKFYSFTALSYSILIPFFILKMASFLDSKLISMKYQKLRSSFNILPANLTNYLKQTFLLLIICLLIFLIKPAVVGELNGTFKIRTIPDEYIKLKDFIRAQPQFFRTFWLPDRQRFGFYDNNHPLISAQSFFKMNDIEKIINALKQQDAKEKLSLSSVKYVIIPFDAEGEIFLTERKYDHGKRTLLEKEIEKIEWLRKKELFPNIAVFELVNHKDHFWLEPEDKGSVSARMVNPTKYSLNIETTNSNTNLIFSEAFDPLWILKVDSKKISSKKEYGLFNSFVLPEIGKINAVVEYLPQRYFNYGLIISILVLCGTIFSIIYLSLKKT
jgi:hypothetical protein